MKLKSICRTFSRRNSFFIDDNLKNAQAVTLLGWHGVHYTGVMETETKLRSLGVGI